MVFAGGARLTGSRPQLRVLQTWLKAPLCLWNSSRHPVVPHHHCLKRKLISSYPAHLRSSRTSKSLLRRASPPETDARVPRRRRYRRRCSLPSPGRATSRHNIQ